MYKQLTKNLREEQPKKNFHEHRMMDVNQYNTYFYQFKMNVIENICFYFTLTNVRNINKIFLKTISP